MNWFRSHGRALWLLLLALITVGLAGCASNADTDNASVRPWNAPRSGDYSGGLPSSMFEGR